MQKEAFNPFMITQAVDGARHAKDALKWNTKRRLFMGKKKATDGAKAVGDGAKKAVDLGKKVFGKKPEPDPTLMGKAKNLLKDNKTLAAGVAGAGLAGAGLAGYNKLKNRRNKDMNYTEDELRKTAAAYGVDPYELHEYLQKEANPLSGMVNKGKQMLGMGQEPDPTKLEKLKAMIQNAPQRAQQIPGQVQEAWQGASPMQRAGAGLAGAGTLAGAGLGAKKLHDRRKEKQSAAAEYEDALSKVASVHNVDAYELHDFLTKEAGPIDYVKGLFGKGQGPDPTMLDKAKGAIGNVAERAQQIPGQAQDMWQGASNLQRAGAGLAGAGALAGAGLGAKKLHDKRKEKQKTAAAYGLDEDTFDYLMEEGLNALGY